MLRCAHRRSLFFCDGVGEERRPWLDACVQSFVSPFACSSASQVISRNSNHGDASVSQSNVRRQHAHAHFRAGGDAKISVCNAGRQDVDANGNVRAFVCSHQDAKRHFVDGDAKVFESSATHSNNGDARVTESVARVQIQSLDLCSPSIWDSLVPNDDTILASSSKFKDDTSDVSNASGETLSWHAAVQTLVIQTQKKVQKSSSDLQQKVELLVAEQFSLSDAAILVKRRAFQSCSFEQLSTVFQVLKEIFPSANVVHDIVLGSSNILPQPAELVQQKLKLLYDFQVEEKVVSRLCSRGKVLSLSVESLQKKLMFYKDTGLTVDARNMMFSKGPLILSLSIENSIQPTVDFLASTGLTRESIWNLGGHCPQVFYMSLDNSLIKRYEYFRQLGFSAEEFARACRCVGRTSIKNMEERMQSLKDRGFTDDNVLLMVKKQPGILSCSPGNMKCKLDFLICEQNRDMAEIVNYPSCLTLSLQGRMIPRFNFIEGLGDSKVYLLSAILSATDSMFIKRFGK